MHNSHRASFVVVVVAVLASIGSLASADEWHKARGHTNEEAMRKATTLAWEGAQRKRSCYKVAAERDCKTKKKRGKPPQVCMAKSRDYPSKCARPYLDYTVAPPDSRPAPPPPPPPPPPLLCGFLKNERGSTNTHRAVTAEKTGCFKWVFTRNNKVTSTQQQQLLAGQRAEGKAKSGETVGINCECN